MSLLQFLCIRLCFSCPDNSCTSTEASSRFGVGFLVGFNSRLPVLVQACAQNQPPSVVTVTECCRVATHQHLFDRLFCQAYPEQYSFAAIKLAPKPFPLTIFPVLPGNIVYPCRPKQNAYRAGIFRTGRLPVVQFPLFCLSNNHPVDPYHPHTLPAATSQVVKLPGHFGLRNRVFGW